MADTNTVTKEKEATITSDAAQSVPQTQCLTKFQK